MLALDRVRREIVVTFNDDRPVALCQGDPVPDCFHCASNNPIGLLAYSARGRLQDLATSIERIDVVGVADDRLRYVADRDAGGGAAPFPPPMRVTAAAPSGARGVHRLRPDGAANEGGGFPPPPLPRR